jgi:hypothetical protein
MDATEALAKRPAVLKFGGREFVILPPTPRDMLAVNARMKALARAKCTSPLDYALSHQHLSGAALEMAVTQALKLGSGGGVRPEPEAVWDEFATLEGVRWRVWYHVTRVPAQSGFSVEEAAALVSEDNLFDAAEALDRALKFTSLDPNAARPATGSSS